MRILRLTTLYPSYVARFYADRPGLGGEGYAAQRKALDVDAFAWADFWNTAFAPLGHEFWDIPFNVEPMQRAWALEHVAKGKRGGSLEEIALRQARWFRPDVLWFDDENAALLSRIRSEVPSIHAVLGWSGSLITGGEVPSRVDLMLSSAPEAVEVFRRKGLRAEVLRHAYDPRIGERLRARSARWSVSFVGHLLPGPRFHDARRRLLEHVAGATPLTVFCPEAGASMEERVRRRVRSAVGGVVRGLRAVGVPGRVLEAQPMLRRAASWQSPGLGPALRRTVHPAVYGLSMYQTLLDSSVTLNIHADSSPKYASNMRLFEASGVGTCLLTDWKEDLNSLLEVDREVAAYRSPEECVEKIRWLLEHPAERDEIARRGRVRAERDHTFGRRAVELEALIRGVLR
jgi:spore maturation protein CgeB